MIAAHLSIADRFGAVDVRTPLSKSYVHIRGKRLQQLCRKHKIKYAEALVGFDERGNKARFGWSPKYDGVVISRRSESKLLLAIEERNARADARPIVTEEVKRVRRQRRQERDVDCFCEAILSKYPKVPPEESKEIAEHTCTIGSGRVGRSGVVGLDSAVELAVRAYVRHNHTEYELLLHDTSDGYMTAEERQEARFEARERVADTIDEILVRWSASEKPAEGDHS